MKMRVTDFTDANEFEYATARDFCRIFDQDLNSLYLLSLLLAGDHEKAEQCFVGALENASSRRTVFKEWARSWARRSIIQSAQRMISPRVRQLNRVLTSHSVDTGEKFAGERIEIAAVLGLEPFDRFVFVMSVLESYSDHECAILLGVARREVIEARARALKQLGREVESRLSQHRVDAGSPEFAGEKPVVEFPLVARSA
jgi:DNA-directed RNA polymerase specialized sigma24 family protein